VGPNPLDCVVELTLRSPGTLQKFSKLPQNPATTRESLKEGEEKPPAAGPSMPRLRSSRSSELRRYWSSGVQHLNQAVKVLDRNALELDKVRSRSRTRSSVARSPPDSEDNGESDDDDGESEEEEESEEDEDEYEG
jgi:hypothetical protein